MAKQQINLRNYIQSNYNFKIRDIGRGRYIVNPCIICGHYDNFIGYENSNSWNCFSRNVGGSIIDFLMQAEGMDKETAIRRVYELSGIKPETLSRADIEKLQAERLKKILEMQQEKHNFSRLYSKLCVLYKAFKEAKEALKAENPDPGNLDFRWLMFNFEFFDRITECLATCDPEQKQYNLSYIVNQYEMESKNFLKWIELI